MFQSKVIMTLPEWMNHSSGPCWLARYEWIIVSTGYRCMNVSRFPPSPSPKITALAYSGVLQWRKCVVMKTDWVILLPSEMALLFGFSGASVKIKTSGTWEFQPRERACLMCETHKWLWRYGGVWSYSLPPNLYGSFQSFPLAKLPGNSLSKSVWWTLLALK